MVDGARVIAEVVEHGRDKKIAVFKYKNKTRYRRRHGHRQDYTRLAIRGILAAGEESLSQEEAKPKRPARKKPTAKAKGTAVAAPEADVLAAGTEMQAPTEEAGARPRRQRRAAKAEAAPRPITEAEPASRSRRKKPTEADANGE